jgi:coproporphyrinogen III oxidase
MTTWASTTEAEAALALVTDLQARFRGRLEALSGAPLARFDWARDAGRHGGGWRYTAAETPVFNRAAINVSQVHYDDAPERALGSATALSTIIHPRHPWAPSVHMHVSWTAPKRGPGAWRVMADLNPATNVADDAEDFRAALGHAAPRELEAALRQGDQYFEIPALGRRRGVVHFYLESHHTTEPDADRALARGVGEAAIDAYASILARALGRVSTPEAAAAQLAYHTVYLFQVLTLDRGTTSGLLVHDQNDLGIMGSLPARVNRALLASWAAKVPPVQRPLVDALVAALPQDGHVTDATRIALAQAVRAHYRAHPEALALQAAGDIVPPTVENHRA